MSTSNKKKKNIPRVLVTAGPTIEPLDPIRFISNYSTGTLGYEIAREGKRQGFEMCLISGPVGLDAGLGIKVINVTTAKEMEKAVLEKIDKHDCIIMTAAVSDFRAEKIEKNKIKKKDRLRINLVKNTDILSKIGAKKNIIKVGFALETERPVENGKKKLEAKKLDFIVVNEKKRGKDPFGEGKKDYMVIGAASGKKEQFKSITKKKMAKIILRVVKNAVTVRNKR